MMVYGVQKLAKLLGESGCYFFSACKVAETMSGVFIDPLLEAGVAIEAKTLRPDCYVNDAAAIISDLARTRCIVLKAGPGHPLPLDYELKAGEREILRFERPNPDGGEPLAHFVVGDGAGRVAWDPWPDSLTVAEGKLISRRIIRPVK